MDRKDSPSSQILTDQLQHTNSIKLYEKYRQPHKLRLLLDSFKTVLKEYCSESSICGLKHLVDDNTPYVERIIWAITMVVALASSVTLVYLTSHKYYTAPLVMTQLPDGVPVDDIIFPAVGICSTNRISRKAVTELAVELLKEPRNKEYDEESMVSELFGLGQLYDLQQPLEPDFFDPMRLHHILGDYDVTELMKNLTPSCSDLLLRCAWNDVTSACAALFDTRLTMNGFCCTFNYLRTSDYFDENSDMRSIDMYNYGNKSSFDLDQGLKVLLTFNESDDFYYSTPLQGAMLQFSDAYDFPDAPSGSFALQMISPGVEMTVFVSASMTEASRDIQHVDVALRGCLFYDESKYLPFYTHSDCMLKCRMQFLLDSCSCTPFNMPKMERHRTCDFRDVPCLRDNVAQSIAVRPESDDPRDSGSYVAAEDLGISCPMCYPTCSKTAYSYEFTNVQIYSDYLNSLTDDKREEWLQGANFTDTSIVHVKYASYTADCYGQNVIMKWFDLFSNFGSTCGFVTGFSFVSVLEFVYFFTVKWSRDLRARTARARSAQQRAARLAAAPPPPPHIPIYWNELATVAKPNTYTFNSDRHIVIGHNVTDYIRSMATVKTYLSIWWTGVKKIPQTTSLHGFRYIADTEKHWTERVFWLAFVIASWYGSMKLIRAQYHAFDNNPISFVVETTYKDWETHFPSVAVCENDNSRRIEIISDKIWGTDHDFNMEEVLKELAYFKGLTYYISQFCGQEPAEGCMKSNLSYYANLVRSSCEDTIANCSWNDISFDCCTYFRPMDTEIGPCFAINSIQGREESPRRLAMVSSRRGGLGALRMDVLVPANVYLLNEEEVPSLTTLGTDILAVGPESLYRRLITVRNIENDAGARGIAPAKRRCRYADEDPPPVHRRYSYSACTVQCRRDAQLRLCNCTNFFMPNQPERDKCDIDGVICLNNYNSELSVLKAKWSSRPGLYCDCLPSCTEAEISIIKDFKVTTTKDYATVIIELASLPSERYRRNVVRGILDLVVSTGGTGGLFLGASILSFVELIYIVFLRPFCDIYSKRDDDHWHNKFGSRQLKDNKFKPNPTLSHRKVDTRRQLGKRFKVNLKYKRKETM